MTRVKSLLFNADWGENRQAHRIHRSKCGRNRRDKETNEAFWKFKRKKIDLSTDWEVKSLLYKNSRYRIK